MRGLVKTALALLPLVGLVSCIPIESDLRTVHYSTVGTENRPLGEGESIAILVKSASDGLAACVRDTLSRNSPSTRLLEAEEIMSAGGVATASHDKVLSDEDVSGLLAREEVQRLASERSLRYVFLIAGNTFESEGSWGCGGLACSGGSNHGSRAAAHVWDTASGRYLGELAAASFGQTGMSGVFPIVLWSYAPTETEACKALADNMSGFLASGEARSDIGDE
jgi:hypothetical protein